MCLYAEFKLLHVLIMDTTITTTTTISIRCSISKNGSQLNYFKSFFFALFTVAASVLVCSFFAFPTCALRQDFNFMAGGACATLPTQTAASAIKRNSYRSLSAFSCDSLCSFASTHVRASLCRKNYVTLQSRRKTMYIAPRALHNP